MAVIIPAFDPRVTIPNTLSGGVNTSDRALLLAQGNAQVKAASSLQAQYVSRIDAALAKLNSASSSAAIDEVLRNQATLISRKSRTNEAIEVVNKALTQIEYLKGHVEYLEEQLDELEAGNITAAEFAVDYDNKLRKINILANAAGQTIKDGKAYYPKNLINSLSRETFSVQTLYAPYNSEGDLFQINGTYLGTDYYITDGNGDFWNSDTGFLDYEEDVGTLSEYSDYPDTATGVSDTVTGITLDAFAAATDTVTFTLSDATQVSGTVTRGGLGLLDAFLYANFDTTADPETGDADNDALVRLREDLQVAESLILTTAAEYRTNLATLESRVDVFDGLINAADTEVANLLRNLQSEPEADLLSAQLESLVANFDFVLLAARGNTLIKSLILAQDNNANTNPYGDTVAVGEYLVGSQINIQA